MTLQMALMLLALVCFILAAARVPETRVSIGWLGAAFVTLTFLIKG